MHYSSWLLQRPRPPPTLCRWCWIIPPSISTRLSDPDPHLRPALCFRSKVEQSFVAGTWDCLGRRSSLLLRVFLVRWARWGLLCLLRWWAGTDCHGSSHVCWRRAFMPLVASVQVGLRVQGIACCRVWQTRVGRTCNCSSLCHVSHKILAWCFCHTSNSSG